MTALRKSAVMKQSAHDTELLARIRHRRNALVGLWAATVLDRDDQEAYCAELSALAGMGDAVLLDRLRRDFEAAGVPVIDEVLQDRIVALLENAAQDLRSRR
ncbi:DUF1476 family protein [Peteryoungia desertarenae]|uniref:DUF1476 family protein n=1 Tax=Peteryoungia desertarenae TaxID=1813451 RepID=A0ABX6QMX5_9HYPH|nr:ATPase inhibitor subunit zeta [Peteryoungia desertarenae]QLF69475.1 DUF1476 family protein [Peteryoungia desertarenae]